MFSYQRLTWRLDKNISSSLSGKPRIILSHSCFKPLPHFLIYKAPPISRLKRQVVTLIGRNDKVAEVKLHQTSILFSSYLKEKRHDNNPIFVITIIIFGDIIFGDHLTSVSNRSPNWRTDASRFPLNTTPSDDSDLLLKNDTLWLLDDDNLLGLRIDSCESLEDESDSLLFPFLSSCHQDSSTSSLLSLTLGASILLNFIRLSSDETDDGTSLGGFPSAVWTFSCCCSSAISIQE